MWDGTLLFVELNMHSDKVWTPTYNHIHAFSGIHLHCSPVKKKNSAKCTLFPNKSVQ